MTSQGMAGRRSAPALDADAILREVVHLYDAALGGDVAVDALDRLAPLFGSRMGALIRIDRQAGTTSGSHFSAGGTAPPAVYEYTAQDIRDDYLYASTERLPAGTTYLGSELLSADVIHRSRIYHRLVAPKALEFVVGGLLENTPDSYSAMGFWRSADLGNYTHDAKRALSLVIPHVRNALQVSNRLAEADGIRREGLEALENTRHGVLLLGPSGRVLFVNPEAERIARAEDGIGLRQGQVVFADARAAVRANDLVALAAANGAGRLPAAGHPLRVSRPSGAPGYEVVVVPVAGGPRRPLMHDRAAVMMLISDPLEAFAVPCRSLVDAYGLTRAEARFCQALLTEGSVAAAAARTGVSINTGRTHLKKIFAKTGVRSQSRLFRLLGTGLGN